MDIRVLRYFLTVAREESFSRAAESLFLSQPTLSRQIREMEEELGVTLFTRTNRSVFLTREGMRLRKRAEEIVDLMDKTRAEFTELEDDISGEIYIGCGETQAMRRIARIALTVRRENPGVRYHLFSGNADDVTERLDKGLLDFGILIGGVDARKYETLRIPGHDTWGLLMRKDHPLSTRTFITPDDVIGLPLLLSRQAQGPGHHLLSWFSQSAGQLNVAATYNLLFNAAMMVEQGMGCALTLDGLANTLDSSELCFRPLVPTLEEELHLVWKKYQVFSPAAEVFLRRVQETFANESPEPL
ncbi:MAG: LysR family transcriptional regulator [Eubacteriales bacterium]|nr:LysR family transcriptional regulator [Eubacteriales bacterium]